MTRRIYFSDKYDHGERRRWPVWKVVVVTVIAAIATWSLMFFGALWIASL